MELQTGDHPGWDRPPVAFTKTGIVSQLATFTTTITTTTTSTTNIFLQNIRNS